MAEKNKLSIYLVKDEFSASDQTILKSGAEMLAELEIINGVKAFNINFCRNGHSLEIHGISPLCVRCVKCKEQSDKDFCRIIA